MTTASAPQTDTIHTIKSDFVKRDAIFATSSQPVVVPSKSAPHILVIGAGVTGCVSSWLLLDQGYRVTILSSAFPELSSALSKYIRDSYATLPKERLASQVGAALWEFPCPPCGPLLEGQNRDSIRRWALESYDVYKDLAARDAKLGTKDEADMTARVSKGTEELRIGNGMKTSEERPSGGSGMRDLSFGVRMCRNVGLYPFPADEYPPERERVAKMEALAKRGKEGILEGFRRDRQGDLVREFTYKSEGKSDNFTQEEGPNQNLIDATEYLAPIIDTDRAMAFLLHLVDSKGAKFVTETIQGDLRAQESELVQKFGADVIVNASGLGARSITDDKDIMGALGALIRVGNGGSLYPKMEAAVIVNTKNPGDHDVVFLVPRSENVLVIGTFFQADHSDHTGEQRVNHQETLTLDSHQVRAMRDRAERFWPPLRNAQPDREYPLAQAWRPYRRGDVRVGRELEQDKRASHIIHAYGHGVYGWTTAFGSAAEVLGLVEQLMIEFSIELSAAQKEARL